MTDLETVKARLAFLGMADALGVINELVGQRDYGREALKEVRDINDRLTKECESLKLNLHGAQLRLASAVKSHNSLAAQHTTTIGKLEDAERQLQNLRLIVDSLQTSEAVGLRVEVPPVQEAGGTGRTYMEGYSDRKQWEQDLEIPREQLVKLMQEWGYTQLMCRKDVPTNYYAVVLNEDRVVPFIKAALLSEQAPTTISVKMVDKWNLFEKRNAPV